MQLSREQIELINSALLKKGINYMDIRIEIIDHLASELESREGDFEENFACIMQNKKSFINEMISSNLKLELAKGFRKLFKNLFSLRFFRIYFLTTISLFILAQITGIDSVLHNLYVLPIVIPGPLTFALLYKMAFSKTKTTDMIGQLSAGNLVFFSYIFLFMKSIKNADSYIWIPIISFFIVLSIMYYIFYFESKKTQRLKYELLSK